SAGARPAEALLQRAVPRGEGPGGGQEKPPLPGLQEPGLRGLQPCHLQRLGGGGGGRGGGHVVQQRRRQLLRVGEQLPVQRGLGAEHPLQAGGPSDQAKRQLAALAGRSASQEPALGSASPPSAQEFAGSLSPAPQRVLGEPRREHFDRLIRQSKLWCYAKGFNADGKSLRPGGRTEPCKAAELQCSGSKSARSPSPLPQKTPRRNAPKGKTQCRNSFSLLGNFPCTPSLVVGEDGDLRPAASLCVKNSCALSKTHPLWSWQVGGSALPVPPSLKFRGYGLEGF
uniref:Elongin BC and Polycomb repressive complex 2-associated protein n=1 Tax=Gopherus evgoodei TaxID=1825980 RepID=A0A8C5EZ70_9SAUR